MNIDGKSAIDDFEDRLKKTEKNFRAAIPVQSLKGIEDLKKSRDEDEWNRKLSGKAFVTHRKQR